MASCRTWSGISAQEAQTFFQEALLNGFVSSKQNIFSWSADPISTTLTGHGLRVGIDYQPSIQKATITILYKSIFVSIAESDEEIFNTIDGYLQKARGQQN